MSDQSETVLSHIDTKTQVIRMNRIFLVPNRFRSLDGSQTVHGYLQQPDRHREFDAFDFTPRTIARGSGLSYVAASMGDDTRSVDMRHFNRVLSFDVANQMG